MSGPFFHIDDALMGRENLVITHKVRGGISQHTRGEALEKLYCEYITNQV